MQLLAELNARVISLEFFLARFPVDINNSPDYVEREVRDALLSNDPDKVEIVMQLIWLSKDISRFVHLLNELLIYPHHISHQVVAKTLQDIGSPSTVPYVRLALASNFDYLDYTCSEPATLAKWFSWLLFAIGTEDAITLMEEYSLSEDEGIRAEMLYRLAKIKR